MTRPGIIYWTALLWAVLVATGCGSQALPEQGAPQATGTTWYHDVKPLMEAHCAGCHSEGNVAPFTLTSYEDVVMLRAAVRQSIVSRSMPPWGAEAGHLELRYDPTLSDAQIAMLVDWLDGDMVEGDPEDLGEPVVLDQGGIVDPDMLVEMETPYTPAFDGRDEYRCFPLDMEQGDDPLFVTGVRGVPGQVEIVHHMVIYVIPPHQAHLVDSYDAEHEGVGYPCYGGPSPLGAAMQINDILQSRFLANWGPGSEGVTFPANSGIKIDPGSRLVLQMHYYSGAGKVVPDVSAVELKTTRSVEREGYYIPWADLQWIADLESMKIPAGEENVTVSYTGKIDRSPITAIFAAGVRFPEGASIHGVLPHMHQLGRRITITLNHGDGTDQTLVNVPSWDFNWQREYHFKEPVFYGTDDEITVECVFDNTAEWRAQRGFKDPTPVDTTWGEGTSDEMCVSLLYVTEPVE